MFLWFLNKETKTPPVVHADINITTNFSEMQFYSAGSLSQNVLCLLFFSSVWAGGDPPETCDFEESSCIWEVGGDSSDWKWERSNMKVLSAVGRIIKIIVSGER